VPRARCAERAQKFFPVTRVCRRTSHVALTPHEHIFFITTKYYHGQNTAGRVAVRAAPPIARGQDVRLALARAGRHDFTTATANPATDVALSVTIVLPQDLQHPVLGDRL